MRLQLLSLIVTDDCNFCCRYCYKTRRPTRMSEATARRAVDRLLPRLVRGGFISFYGGEPLLEIGLIRETVAAARSKGLRTGVRPRFSITTNGSLIDEDILAFLDRERFAVTLSYDGSGQNLQRRPGSGAHLLSVIDRMRALPRLRFEVNSVFTPRSVGSLSGTVLSMIARGVPRVHFALSAAERWSPRDIGRLGRQVKRLRAGVLERCGRLDRSPVINFRDEALRRIRACNAGQDRLAVDTRGRIWGCVLFADLFRDGGDRAAARRLSFGSIRAAVRPGDGSFRRVAARYARFSMDRAETPREPCYQCPGLGRCWVCPVRAVLAGGAWTAIPDFVCRMQRACLSGAD